MDKNGKTMVTVRMTPRERAQIRRAAAVSGTTMQSFCFQHLTRIARDVIEASKEKNKEFTGPADS